MGVWLRLFGHGESFFVLCVLGDKLLTTEQDNFGHGVTDVKRFSV